MTTRKEELVDVTAQVDGLVAATRASRGMCLAYVPHATAAMLINEAEPNLTHDFLTSLDALISGRAYLHDTIDDNAAAHLKSGILGPGRVMPVLGGRLALGTWQRVMLCEFDGPRERTVVVEVVEAK